jgi:SPP1 gp7 family putative phage head morphogenesis protein
MALSDDILDATIRHSVYLERHKASVIRQIIGLIGDVNDDVVAQIIKAKIDGMPRRHVDQLLANLRRTIKDGYSPVITVLDDEIRALGIQEARFQKRMLENTIPIRLTFDIPADEQIYAAATARPFEGRLLDEWYRGLPDGAFRRVQDAIRMGYVEGRTTAQIVQDIRGTRTQAGIIEQSKRGAEAAVRTALAHTANVAKEEVYKRNRSKIKGIEWVSTLDGRTSAICRGFDGKVFPVNEGPRPPAHVNCRSTTIPVIKHARNFSKAALATTRASMNGQVSSELNYDEWLRRQPISFQDDVLGPTKGKLFRAGLKMDRFIDRKGAELTLKQIEEREADIWAKAFGAKTPPKPAAQPKPEPEPISTVSIADIVTLRKGSSFTVQELEDRFNSQLTDVGRAVVAKLPRPSRITAGDGLGVYRRADNSVDTGIERQIVTHEYGHHVDHMLGSEKYRYWSTDGLTKAWTDDRKSTGVFNVSAQNKSQRMQAIFDELFVREQATKVINGKTYAYTKLVMRFDGADGISDIIDSFTNGAFQSVHGAYGHGSKYWRDRKGTGGQAEAFANMFAFQNSPDAIRWMETNMPNLWKAFLDKMKEVANG